MTSEELFALAFAVYAVVGVLLNYNLVYAAVNKKKEWSATRLFNKGFFRSHRFFGLVHFILALIFYAFWELWFNEEGFWFSSLAIDIFMITRIMAWFVLARRAHDELKRIEMGKIGPDGSIAPERAS